MSRANQSDVEQSPSLYILNAAALSKPHAVEHLAAVLTSHNTDIALISETPFKAKHTDTVVGVENYTCFIGVIEMEGEEAAWLFTFGPLFRHLYGNTRRIIASMNFFGSELDIYLSPFSIIRQNRCTPQMSCSTTSKTASKR
jgi:hypothetical protein